MQVEERWIAETDEWINTSPTVVDETVYAGCEDGNLYAFATETGTERWRFETDDEISAAPAVADGIVLAPSEDGHLYAIDATDGSERWRHQFDSLVYDIQSPAVLDGTVLGGTKEHGTNHVYAFDIEQGTERWVHEIEEGIETAPVVVEHGNERTLVVVVSPTMGDPSLVGFDVTDGTERWRFTSEHPLETAPTIAMRQVDTEASAVERPTVFLPDRYRSVMTRAYDAMVEDNEQTVPPSIEEELSEDPGGSIFGFDAATGERRLQISVPGAPTTVPTVADGTVYVGTGGGQLIAADATTGEIAWEQPLGLDEPTSVTAAPTVVGEYVLVGTRQGALLGVDTESGDLDWFAPVGLPQGAPTVADGTVYIGSHDGVRAIDLPDCSASSRDSRVRRATLGHHDETAHRRAKLDLDGACPNCRIDLSAVDEPSYCWECGWEL